MPQSGGGIGAQFPTFHSSDPKIEDALNGMAREVERLSQMPRVTGVSVISNGCGVFSIPNQPTEPFLTKNDSGSTWTKGSTVTCHLYSVPGGGTRGAETNSGIQIQNVLVRLGDVPVNAWAYIWDIYGLPEVWVAGCGS